jgi:hypothetical protein
MYKLKKNMTKLQKQKCNNTLYIGTLAIRKYTSDRVFNEIENEMMSFSQNTKHIALAGDFNSRTTNLTDYILPDEDVSFRSQFQPTEQILSLR